MNILSTIKTTLLIVKKSAVKSALRRNYGVALLTPKSGIPIAVDSVNIKNISGKRRHGNDLEHIQNDHILSYGFYAYNPNFDFEYNSVFVFIVYEWCGFKWWKWSKHQLALWIFKQSPTPKINTINVMKSIIEERMSLFTVDDICVSLCGQRIWGDPNRSNRIRADVKFIVESLLLSGNIKQCSRDMNRYIPSNLLVTYLQLQTEEKRRLDNKRTQKFIVLAIFLAPALSRAVGFIIDMINRFG